jgi:hypothetical protein
LSRPSTSSSVERGVQDLDARDKGEHDGAVRHCENSEAIQNGALDGPWIASSLRSSQ